MFKIRFHYWIVRFLVRFMPKLFNRYFMEYLEANTFDRKNKL